MSIKTRDSIKCVIVGDAGIGKTTLLDRTINDRIMSTLSTIGVECRVVRLAGHKETRVRFWDTAGQESFHSVTRIYYRGVDCALVCYDANDSETLENVKTWVEEIRREHEGISRKTRRKLKQEVDNRECCGARVARNCGDDKYVELVDRDFEDEDNEDVMEVPILMVALKVDGPGATKTTERARALASELQIQGPFFTSAVNMNRDHLQKLFLPFFRTVQRNVLPEEDDQSFVDISRPHRTSYFDHCCTIV